MRESILLLFICFTSITSTAQKKYTCEFSDSVITVLPDSILRQLSNIKELQGVELTADMMEQIFIQLKAAPLSMYQLRTVNAAEQGSIVTIDRSSRTGNTIRETFDSLRYINDDIYIDSASISGFSIKPITSPRKEFMPTGKSKVIMKYKCSEYISTDSTCNIWVTTELPDYVNPGIRKGEVKGAVLAFELKTPGTTNKCELIRFGRRL